MNIPGSNLSNSSYLSALNSYPQTGLYQFSPTHNECLMALSTRDGQFARLSFLVHNMPGIHVFVCVIRTWYRCTITWVPLVIPGSKYIPGTWYLVYLAPGTRYIVRRIRIPLLVASSSIDCFTMAALRYVHTTGICEISKRFDPYTREMSDVVAMRATPC